MTRDRHRTVPTNHLPPSCCQIRASRAICTLVHGVGAARPAWTQWAYPQSLVIRCGRRFGGTLESHTYMYIKYYTKCDLSAFFGGERDRRSLAFDFSIVFHQ